MFSIRQIDRLRAEDIEWLGTKAKFWFTIDDTRYLFKAEERGTGEDWAEKVVCELARLLGMPHVDYELAHECEGAAPVRPGVVCPSFSPKPLSLLMGNQLLVRRDPNYPAAAENKYGVKDYTIEVVSAVVAALNPPSAEWMLAVPAGVVTAVDVFAGYLLLDAWTANQDRHHQNWGAIQEADGTLRLAPTYDHGSALAPHLLDEERKERLVTKDRNRTVENFAGKGRSGFYASAKDEKTMLALDVFRWFAERHAVAAKLWLGRLDAIGSDAVDAVLAEIPPARMSPVTREFTLKLLTINRRRLLEGYSA